MLNGAALLPFDLKEHGLARLAEWLIREQITLVTMTASMFRSFATTLSKAMEFPHVRLVGIGGEPTYKSDIELCQRHFSADCVVYSGLGTTEAGNICQYFIDGHTDLAGDAVSVGYASQGADVLLLDDQGKAVGPASLARSPSKAATWPAATGAGPT